MSENIVVNGVVYNGVDSISMRNGNGETVPFYPDAVRYNEQNLDEAQKAQARKNIGVADGSGVHIGANEPTDGATVWIDTDEEAPQPSVGKDGKDGVDGKDGKSAYQYAVEGGYTGTEADFAAKLAQDIPEAIQADWSANEGEPGHILNRTHYETGKKTRVVLEKTLTIANNQWIDLGRLPLEAGKTYNAVWDGAAYVCEAFVANVMGLDAVCIGNPFLVQTGANNNMPFAFGSFVSQPMSAAAAMANGEHTLKIMEEVAEYHPIPEGALPDILIPKVIKIPAGSFAKDNYTSPITVTSISYDEFAEHLWNGGTVIFDMSEVTTHVNGVIEVFRKQVVDWAFIAEGDLSEKYFRVLLHSTGGWTYNGNSPEPRYFVMQFPNGTWLPPLT